MPATVLPNAILVRPSAGVTAEEVATAINASVPDAEALTRADAAQRTPGVAQVRQSFQVIFLLYGLVVPLVTGLFFLIVTLQKAGSLTLLRAVGARAGTLAWAPARAGGPRHRVGLALGVALYTPVSQAQVGGLSLRFDARAVVVWSGLFLALALPERPGVAATACWHRPARSHHRGGSAMKIALRELRRRPGRFGAATAILTLIAVLLMFLGGLLDGLIARRPAPTAPRMPTSSSTPRTLATRSSGAGSRPTCGPRSSRPRASQAAGGIGSRAARRPAGQRSGGPQPHRDDAVRLRAGAPRPSRRPATARPGRAPTPASAADGRRGRRHTPARPCPLTGRGDRVRQTTRYSGQGSLWGSPDTWRQVTAANRPDEAFQDGSSRRSSCARRRRRPAPGGRPHRPGHRRRTTDS